MTSDELRERIKAAGGRGCWEYYDGSASGFAVTIIADHNGKTLTQRVDVLWLDLEARRTSLSEFETVTMARTRNAFAKTLGLLAASKTPG